MWYNGVKIFKTYERGTEVEKMRIPIVIDPLVSDGYIYSYRFQDEFSKLVAKKKYEAVYIDGNAYREFDYDGLFEGCPRLVVLYSSLYDFVSSALSFFQKNNIDVILLGSDVYTEFKIKGLISVDVKQIMETYFSHLDDCGCARPALYGCFENSSGDRLKEKCFLEELQARGVSDPDFYCIRNTQGFEHCAKTFFEKLSSFDSVICPNTIAAISLSKKLMERGIRIPEDIQMISDGALKSTELFPLSFTGFHSESDFTEAQKVISAYRFMYEHPDPFFQLRIFSTGELYVGNTTLPLKKEKKPLSVRVAAEPRLANTFYGDNEVIAFVKMERLLNACDRTDIELIQLLLEGCSYEQIAERIFLSTGTVFYRMKRLQGIVSARTRKELEEFLREYSFNSFFDK